MEYRIGFKSMSNSYSTPIWALIECDQILYEDRWVMLKRGDLVVAAYTTDYIFSIELIEESEDVIK